MSTLQCSEHKLVMLVLVKARTNFMTADAHLLYRGTYNNVNWGVGVRLGPSHELPDLTMNVA